MSVASALGQEPWTFEAVEDLERRTGERYEFIDGAPRMMADASDAHHLLEVELSRQLANQLTVGPNRGQCRPLPSNAKVRVRDPASKNYRYPDLTVFCGDRERHPGTTTLYTNPTIVFEILSPGSQKVDEGAKADEYASLESVQAYVMIHQDQRRVTLRRRTPERGLLDKHHSAGVVELPGVPAVLDIDELYAALDE